MTGSSAGPTRRRFLRATGVGVAGAASLAAGARQEDAAHTGWVRNDVPGAAIEGPPLTRDAGPGFDHLVVLMFENRSFDNVLGYLYEHERDLAATGFDGLADKQPSNTAPDGRTIPAHRYTGPTARIMSSPDPDPGEEYPHVNTQLFGIVDPPSNADRHVTSMSAPYNAPAAGTTPTMSGFVTDYVNTYRASHHGAEPPAGIVDQIMGSLTPDMLPVLSTLAKEFAVFDAWHSAVPSQTYCNRSFFHASTSHGFVTNHDDGGYEKWLDPALADVPTVFQRLSDAGRTWRVYFDDRQFISMTGFIHAPALERYWRTNFSPMSVFHADVAAGTLPDYAFIEPRMLYDHNDMHPPYGPNSVPDEDGGETVIGTISDVRAGDALLHEIYDAIRLSATPTGSNALNTMLVVTFDEHGGTYDHVPPPAAVPPEERADTEMGFGFDRLGPRVPALAISAFTRRGSVVHDEMHHGSVIATLAAKHGFPPLTARDANANTLDGAVSLDTARQPSTWPRTIPQWLPVNPESTDPVHDGDGEMPLTAPGVGLMGMLVRRFGTPGEPIPKTYREAFDAVERYGRGLFGSG